MKESKWAARLRRAAQLGAAHPAAAQGLRFYEEVTGFQQALYEGVDGGGAALGSSPPRRAAVSQEAPPGSLRERLDLQLLLPWLPTFLELLRQIAPSPLAEAARALGDAGAARGEVVLAGSWSAAAVEEVAGLDAAEALICWLFLQPYAEWLADTAGREEEAAEGGVGGGGEVGAATPRLCPLCGARPLVGVLRPQGDGGRRALVCSLCAHEWDYRRIVCAACGEEAVDKLPVYTAAELPHLRVEACDSCRRYLVTVDMTRDGRAVPAVDELTAIPLSLWAAEHGYTKIRSNCLGI